MTGTLVRDLLDIALDAEPPTGDLVSTVYQRAEKLRRARIRNAALAGACVTALVAAIGWGVTTVLTPGPAGAGPAGVAAGARSASASRTDRTAPLAARALDGRGVEFRPAGRGDGWRRYTVLDHGRNTGTLDVVVYAATAELCLPTTATSTTDDCAPLITTENGLRYVSYADPADPARQFTEVVVERQSDTRVFAVHAAGLPPTGAAGAGKAPLSVAEAQQIALDRSLPETFGADEWCDRPDPACPVLGVPAPPDHRQ
jgi:hypothetical protein